MNTLTCCVSCICSHCSVFPVSTGCWSELSHKRTRRNIRIARFSVSHTHTQQSSFPSTLHHLRPITLLYAHSYISWGSPCWALFGLLYICSPVASPPHVLAVQRGTPSCCICYRIFHGLQELHHFYDTHSIIARLCQPLCRFFI